MELMTKGIEKKLKETDYYPEADNYSGTKSFW